MVVIVHDDILGVEFLLFRCATDLKLLLLQILIFRMIYKLGCLVCGGLFVKTGTAEMDALFI